MINVYAFTIFVNLVYVYTYVVTTAGNGSSLCVPAKGRTNPGQSFKDAGAIFCVGCISFTNG